MAIVPSANYRGPADAILAGGRGISLFYGCQGSLRSFIQSYEIQKQQKWTGKHKQEDRCGDRKLHKVEQTLKKPVESCVNPGGNYSSQSAILIASPINAPGIPHLTNICFSVLVIRYF